jgi:hypothetical protein
MPQEANQFLSQYLSAFPDAQATVEDLLADGAKVVARVSILATHRGAFRGIAPTGKPITVMGSTSSASPMASWCGADAILLVMMRRQLICYREDYDDGTYYRNT